MKWKRVDLIPSRNPTDADAEEWERQWRDEARTIAERLDKLSDLLTQQSFNSFLYQRPELLEVLHLRFEVSKGIHSPKEFFVRELFHRRNRIVHFGMVDFQQPDAETCFALASILSLILAKMDTERRLALEAKHSIYPLLPQRD
jgi:hypothetical protein